MRYAHSTSHLKVWKKGFALLLALAFALTLIPAWGSSAYALEGDDTRVADPDTSNTWAPIFSNASTEHAGGVWTDKSVEVNAGDADLDSFLVTLSAMSSTESVVGKAHSPTDTMLILDLSSSMYRVNNTTTVPTMLSAVNSSITKLQNLNPDNRVGVVIYFGGPGIYSQSKSTDSMIMLPLGRYNAGNDGTYLSCTISNNDIDSVQVSSGVTDASGNDVPKKEHNHPPEIAGTYAQLGIIDAAKQFLEADTQVNGVTRTPIFVFMSDGEPTAATDKFADLTKTDAIMGNNRVANRDPNETDFLTQLTAAYAKKKADDHYAATTPLFYTLSLGNSISYDVMDPAGQDNSTINNYWSALVADGKVDINYTTYKASDAAENPTNSKTCTVSKTDGFPTSTEQRKYVDQHFSAAEAKDLADAFEAIVNQVSLHSSYYPTLVEGENYNFSGNVSFLDKVGEYMTVTDVKGIYLHGALHTGANLAKDLTDLLASGNIEAGNLSAKEKELLNSAVVRLGISEADVIELMKNAVTTGQMSYTSDTEFSNYVGWYADAGDNYLGFWNEQDSAVPDGAVYRVKSYAYMGHVDTDRKDTDLLYATVRVREELATGRESVIFSVPASLIPTKDYKVYLDEDNKLEKLAIEGADSPVRLQYEVALDPAITPSTLRSIVSSSYISKNLNSDGSVNFYTNMYEADGSVGYGKVNTYSYFRPNHENGHYYYQADAPLYTKNADDTFSPCTGEKPTADSQLYWQRTIYTDSGIVTRQEPVVLTEEMLAVLAQDASTGVWYIPADTVQMNFADDVRDKVTNDTGTLGFSFKPYTDVYGHSLNEPNHYFVVGATLGNNGRLNVKPDALPTPYIPYEPMPTPTPTPTPTPSATPELSPELPNTGDGNRNLFLPLLAGAALVVMSVWVFAKQAKKH